MENLIYVNNPKVRNFCEALEVEEFSEENIMENQSDCLVLFNLAQMRNPSENFKHYFENNQINYDDFPLFWPEEKLKLIKNTFMEKTLIDMNHTLDYFNSILEKSSYFPKYSMNDLKRAFILMNSQNFKIKIKGITHIVIIPFLDIYRIEPTTNVDWAPEIHDASKGLVLKAMSDISKGSPLITNYGDSDNASLLLNYGFTLEKNSFPAETEFFEFDYKEINYSMSLNMDNIDGVFETLERIKADNEMNSYLSLQTKKRKSNKNHNSEIDEDIKLLNIILKNLGKFANKKRLENLSITANQTNNRTDKDILRALNAEDKLINKNMQDILEVIQILKTKGETKSLVKDQNKLYQIYKKYFDKVFFTKEHEIIKAKNSNNKRNYDIDKEDIRNIVITYSNSI